jgi:hypothetical protein
MMRLTFELCVPALMTALLLLAAAPASARSPIRIRKAIT